MFSRNKIDKDNFYLSIVLVGLLLFIFGFSVGHFAIDRAPSNKEIGSSTSHLDEQKESPTQPKSKLDSYLFGAAIKGAKRQPTTTMTVRVDLTSVYPDPPKEHVVRKFMLVDGETMVYEVPRENIGGSRKEVGFGRIAEEDLVAFLCSDHLEGPEDLINNDGVRKVKEVIRLVE